MNSVRKYAVYIFDIKGLHHQVSEISGFESLSVCQRLKSTIRHIVTLKKCTASHLQLNIFTNS